MHRPSNVDASVQLLSLAGVLTAVSKVTPVAFPVHPRTRNALENSGLVDRSLRLLSPLGYLDFLHLTANARLVMTDLGGIQEESTILGLPCLTLR